MQNYESLVQKASLLRLSALTIAEGMKTGNFRSMYRGRGVEFTGVREYLRGDDVRSIDWNVTARMGKPFVKLFEEDRELIVFLIVDHSLSMKTGFAQKSKLQTANEIAALMAFAAEQNNSPLGAVIFDGEIKFSATPKSGKNQTMIVLKHLEENTSTQKGSVLGNSLRGAYQLLKNRSLVLILSDFRSSDYEKEFARLASKHDVIAVKITDSSDTELPKAGFLSFCDPETKAIRRLPTSSLAFQKEWRHAERTRQERWKTMCQKRGGTPLIISTKDDTAQELINFFSSKDVR